MEVSNPKRVLAVSLADEANHLRRVIRDLSGSAPSPLSTSLAGTTHHVALDTQYYKASVPVWLDLVASPAEWAESFLSDEASEVLAVLGGLVVVFALPAPGAPADALRLLIRHVGRVVNAALGGWEWEGVRLAVGVGEAGADDWDELCAEAGLEFVQVGPGRQTQSGLNEFGERTGMARVKEALEANDWAQPDSPPFSDFGDFEAGSDGHPEISDADLDPENLDFGFDRADFEWLRKAIWSAGQQDSPPAENAGASSTREVIASDDAQDGDGACGKGTGPAPGLDGDDDAGVVHDDEVVKLERMIRKLQAVREAGAGLGEAQRDGDDDAGVVHDDEVVKLERMMRKLQAVREAGAGLGEAQRKKMAAHAVAEAMREL